MIITNSSSLLAPDNKERESSRWYATKSSPISSVGDKISLSGELCSLSGELLSDDDSNLDAV